MKLKDEAGRRPEVGHRAAGEADGFRAGGMTLRI
jgi:hypothetical protein